jgi:hypothetical protein
VNPKIALSVVIGVQHAQDNLPDILRALRPADRPDVEFLFCHTPADPEVATLAGNQSRIRTIVGPRGSLIPHLWRDGILAALGDRVATTTAHCIPAADWVDALLAADLGQTAAVGGIIQNDPQAGAEAQAIFLLRYAAFAPPQVAREVHEVAADNALYRRPDLLRHRNLLVRGFWEPSFHDRFRAEGSKLALDPSLQVVHRNRYTARQFMRQRFAHGREFGLTRTSARPIFQRLFFVLVAPAVFPLLSYRIVRRVVGQPSLRPRSATAWFWLPLFLLAWVAGEMSGYLAGLRGQKS